MAPLQGAQNRPGQDSVKSLLIDKSETQRLIILLGFQYDLPYSVYVVYSAKSSAETGLLWWLKVVQPSRQLICNNPRKQLVDVAQERYRTVVIDKGLVIFLKK